MATHEMVFEESFSPLYGDVFRIPPGTLFWRGFDPKFPNLSDRPAYYSNKHVASGYVDPSKGLILGAFYSTQTLNVLDVRFLKTILKQMFEESRGSYTKEDTKALLCVQTSFGLCSLGHQIELMETIYTNVPEIQPGLNSMKSIDTRKILEQEGVRVAETNMDGFVMSFLKGLFESLTNVRIDGFISPRLVSPFHIEKENLSMSPEMIVFNPSKLSMRHLEPNVVPENLPKVTPTSLLYSKNHSTLTLDYGHFKTSFRIPKGGGISSEPAIEAFNRKLNKKDRMATKLYKAGYSAGKRWAQIVPPAIWIEPPVPTIPLNIRLNTISMKLN